MTNDRIKGKVIRFKFDNGPMAGKAFDHSFETDGTVTFRQVGGATPDAAKGDARDSKETPATKYEVESIRDDIAAVSYRSSSGYTLTTILDFKTSKLVAFSSNEKTHSMQHGTFAVASSAVPAEPRRRDEYAARH